MSVSTTSGMLTPTAFWRWGSGALASGLVLGLLLLLLLAWYIPPLLFVCPLLLLVAVGVVYLVRHPLLHLCVIVGGTVAILGMQEGLQVYEAGYGLYYLSYLAGWFISTIYLHKERIIYTSIDAALVLFVVYATLSLCLTIVFGGNFQQALMHWMPLVFFGLYFPIRDAIRRYPDALKALLITFAFILAFILTRNFVIFINEIGSADHLWQIAGGRVRANERFLMMGIIGVVVYFVHGRSWVQRIFLLFVMAVLSAGVLIGRSRAVWLSLLLGLGVVLLLVDKEKKLQLAVFLGGGFATIVLFGWYFMGDAFLLILGSLIERFGSIYDAFLNDISLINRFKEWGAVWEAIANNPIVGYGYGVPFHFFNIILDHTQTKAHIHNTYLGLWYRHGVIGLFIFLYMMAAAAFKGTKLYLSRKSSLLRQIVVLGCLASLVALMLSATTESLLLQDNTVLELVLPLAVIGGIYHDAIQPGQRPPLA